MGKKCEVRSTEHPDLQDVELSVQPVRCYVAPDGLYFF